MAYYIGVDVGTASVRAALVCEKGSILETSEEPIIIWNQQPSFYEQSSENIWKAVITVVNVRNKFLNRKQVRMNSK